MIRSDHGWKIGKTTKLSHRLSTFNVQLPFKFTLSFVIFSQDIDSQESTFHRQFREKRICGEWFDLNDDDIAELSVWATLGALMITPDFKEQVMNVRRVLLAEN